MRFYSYLFVVFSALAVSESLAGQPHYLIFTLPWSSWEAAETRIERDPDGNLRTVDHTPNKLFGSQDFQDSFQDPPLQANRFLPEGMFDEVKQSVRRGVQSSQIIFLIQHADLSEDEARRLIPSAEEFEQRSLAAPPGRAYIRLGAMWAIRGFWRDQDQSPQPLPLSWTSATFDARRGYSVPRPPALTTAYEIGRAYVERGELRGQLPEMSSVMVQVLRSEADAFGLDPRDVVLTTYSLDYRQNLIFARTFPLRILDRAAIDRLANEGSIFLNHYEDLPLPDPKGWRKHNDATLFGTLAAFARKFTIVEHSRFAKRVMAEFKGLLPEQALFLWRDILASTRHDVEFASPVFGESTKPLIVTSMFNAWWLSDLLLFTDRRGIARDSASLEPLDGLSRLLAEYNLSDPDNFSVNYYENNAWMHPALRSDIETLNDAPAQYVSHLIVNLDPVMVQRFPRTYSAAVILGVAERLTAQLMALSVRQKEVLLILLNRDRQRQSLKPVRQLSGAAFFDTYGVAAASTDPQIISDLKALGGQERPGCVIAPRGTIFGANIMQPGGPDIVDEPQQPYPSQQPTFFLFKTADFDRLNLSYRDIGRYAAKFMKSAQTMSCRGVFYYTAVF